PPIDPNIPVVQPGLLQTTVASVPADVGNDDHGSEYVVASTGMRDPNCDDWEWILKWARIAAPVHLLIGVVSQNAKLVNEEDPDVRFEFLKAMLSVTTLGSAPILAVSAVYASWWLDKHEDRCNPPSRKEVRTYQNLPQISREALLSLVLAGGLLLLGGTASLGGFNNVSPAGFAGGHISLISNQYSEIN
ncbi:MAG: hypothetical protein HY540_06870, partial [Deltaproteobacteria bacterium]|nr:hypothetical protein [Deltaproteobacteria bacterium]